MTNEWRVKTCQNVGKPSLNATCVLSAMDANNAKKYSSIKITVVENVDTTVCRPKTKEIETVANAVCHAR